MPEYMEKIIQEETVKIHAYVDGKVSKKLPVFYNPVMKLNRDVSILLLNSAGKNGMQIADPLAGSGIRSIRFLKELEKGIILNLSLNDLSKDAVKNISKNMKLNGIRPDKERLRISNEDANLFLLNSTGFDYIDIDPFGSPCPFLDSAVKRISRGGILAVTATDTAALAGSSRNACLRKYWAEPMRNTLMHEVGMRILARRVQLIGAEHEKALTPIFTYTDQHYYRLFFSCEKGRQKVDELLREHKYLLYNPMSAEVKTSGTVFNTETGWISAGPLWAGALWDIRLVKAMQKNCEKNDPKLASLVAAVEDEAKVDAIGFYSVNLISGILKLGEPPKRELVISRLINRGFSASRTHFDGQGIRTDAPLREVYTAFRQ
jgi:tRNA (guanine26-N2/guanine27-N2)-dimethyltransferase